MDRELPEKSLALIENASGQDAEGARNGSEAFSIRRLEGRRWRWCGAGRNHLELGAAPATMPTKQARHQMR